MFKRLGLVALVGLLFGGGTYWAVTAPSPLTDADVAGLSGDAIKGEAVFWAAGCASCHMAPGASGEAELILSGGQTFASPFGTFLAPNISPDPTHGIGGWTLAQFASAVMRGVSPDGSHYFPAFPYSAYNKASPSDIADLKAFMDGLPPSSEPSKAHEVGFPFNIRRNLGGWKFLFLSEDWVLTEGLTPEETRGRYLVEALAHCGECHTPRNALGGLESDRWMAGGAVPGGKGSFPNITPAKLTWSQPEIVEYLTSGFTPEFDSVGGHMAHVVSNMARLPLEDREAVAAYVKKLPPAE
jgi:mono/diheme cytochrome c family protein